MFIVTLIVSTYAYIVKVIELAGIHDFHKPPEGCVLVHVDSDSSTRIGDTDILQSLHHEVCRTWLPVPKQIPVGIEQVLGVKTILMGFGLESDAIHSPNENFRLDIFRRGIEAVAEVLRTEF